MAVRHRFGADLAAWVFATDVTDTNLVLQSGQTVTFWDAATAGSQYTDLRAANGTTPITSVSTGTGDSAGLLPMFFGPVGVAAMWAQAGGGARALIVANDLGDTATAGTTETLYDLGSRTGAFTIDQANGSAQTVTLIGNVTPTIPAPAAVGKEMTLFITQDSTGGRTVTWPANVALAEGALRLSAAPTAVDIVSFRWDGTAWRERTRSLAKSQDAFSSLVNVRAFGALGNGTTDDRPAIQAAIDFAAAIGTGIWLPVGTYPVSPDPASRTCLRLTAGIKGIYGAHSSLSIIRVLAGVSQYHSVVSNYSSASGYASTGTAISGIELRDFTIDQNTVGNIVPNATTSGPLYNSYPRFCIGIGGATTGNVEITNIRCVDTDGINTITVQGRDLTIRDCELAVSSSATDHDHSAIYTNVGIVDGQSTLFNNLIYGPSSPVNPGARTAIETHGGAQLVTHNTIRFYFKGGNLTGVSNFTGEGVVWSNNRFLNVRYGVQLWALEISSYHSALTNVQVTQNTITLDPVSWNPTGSTSCLGIFLDTSANNVDTGNSLAYQDVLIAQNHIRFLSGHVGTAGDSINHGIDWRRTFAPKDTTTHDRNIRILDNFIDSPIASGIRYTSVAGDYIDGLVIRGNRIRNVGQGTSQAGNGGALNNGNANGLMIAGALKNSRIENNDLIDDQATHTMNVGLWLAAQYTGGSNNVVRNNRIIGAYGAPYLFSASIDGGYFVEGEVATWAAPTGSVVLGSQLRAADTGLMYRQTATPIGTAWSSYTPGASGGSGGTTTSTPPDIQSFTATGTWTKPASAKTVMVTCVAAGGGGGSGARAAAGQIRAGGGGGGGGGITHVMLDASGMAATVAVTVGAGGAGGAAVATDSTAGSPGSAGGISAFGTYVRAQGGTGGGGGTFAASGNVTGSAGSGNVGTSIGGNGAAASTTAGAGQAAGLAAGAPGGGSGGGINAANTATAGGASVSSFAQPAGGTGGAGGSVDTTPPTAGGSVPTGPTGLPLPGGGGGGGASSITAAAQGGADGGAFGAGAGGGGAAVNGNNSGSGGTGGVGFVQVVTYF